MNKPLQEEYSSGGVVRKKIGSEYHILLIRVKKEGLELPKGHIELNEVPEETSKREINPRLLGPCLY